MKTNYLILFLLACTIVANAQKADKALLRVSYNFIHVQDTNHRDQPYTENMILVIGKNASVYTSYDKITQAAIRRKMIEEAVKAQSESPNQTLKLDGRGIKKTNPVDYFSFINERKSFTKERLINNYLVEEPTPQLNWKISKDTASFSGIKCQKATATFKGRNWIAWFAAELPFQSGPWKLSGLPGLIIEAYDDKKDVQFLFAGIQKVDPSVEIEKTNENKEPRVGQTGTVISVVSVSGAGSSSENPNEYMGAEISLPADAIKTTRKELEKLKEASKKDPMGFMNAQMAGRVSGIQVTGYSMKATATGSSTQPKTEINNPIELAEQ
ncbi:GLPGLI family protein [Pedobacter aquatilis]|uniref:GLPGLI family protein n=1 Tax=Pedobacter aquatilis TaxID=351343 RepID=UPI00292FF750|nr:GLPGLI family protein [Pedobacter aquatilis]